MAEATAAGAGEEGAVWLERVGAVGRVMVETSGRPAGASDWRRWAEAYELWVADPNVYGGLIRQGDRGLSSRLRDAAAWAGRFNRHDAGATAELADFYRLIWTVDRFSKPTVSLLDGEVSWSDFCLARVGTHKVVGETFQLSLAAPEGWFLDAGATWWLSRLPDHLGELLALTGVTIDGADALALGLATHRILASSFAAIERAYAEADPIDQVLDGLPQLTGGGEITRIPGSVLAAFGEARSDAIISRLARIDDPMAGVVGGRMAYGHHASVPDRILALIREARELTLQQSLERDYAIALALAGPEHRPFTGLKPGSYDPFRARAAAELALKPPPSVPEALG